MELRVWIREFRIGAGRREGCSELSMSKARVLLFFKHTGRRAARASLIQRLPEDGRPLEIHEAFLAQVGADPDEERHRASNLRRTRHDA